MSAEYFQQSPAESKILANLVFYNIILSSIQLQIHTFVLYIFFELQLYASLALLAAELKCNIVPSLQQDVPELNGVSRLYISCCEVLSKRTMNTKVTDKSDVRMFSGLLTAELKYNDFASQRTFSRHFCQSLLYSLFPRLGLHDRKFITCLLH